MKNAIRVGVLGTCFTRSQFNSSDPFYNQDYKLYYNVGFSQFHSSIISALSQSAIDYDTDEFLTQPRNYQEDVRRELNRTIIRDLQSSNIEYLLIDFYIDVIHGVRKLEDGEHIAVIMWIRDSNLFKNIVQKKSTQFDLRSDDYFDFWKRAIDQFLELVKGIIPEHKIILNKGGLVEDYYDENRQLRSFPDEKIVSKKVINKYNSLWNKMNNYFLTKVPNAKFIDMDIYNYKGDVTHPQTVGPHHYESAYYKSLLGEVSKVILFDKIHEQI